MMHEEEIMKVKKLLAFSFEKQKKQWAGKLICPLFGFIILISE